jgi:predicted amidophosphoribosyltransferase
MADLFATFCQNHKQKESTFKKEISCRQCSGKLSEDTLQCPQQEEPHPYKVRIVRWIVEIHHGSPTKSDGW